MRSFCPTSARDGLDGAGPALRRTRLPSPSARASSEVFVMLFIVSQVFLMHCFMQGDVFAMIYIASEMFCMLYKSALGSRGIVRCPVPRPEVKAEDPGSAAEVDARFEMVSHLCALFDARLA